MRLPPGIEKGAADRIAHWREHPLAMVRELFHVEPDAWQQEALEAFPSSPRLAQKACKGPGKAQPHDTPIYTPWGQASFGMLKPGDRVFAGDGTITTVRGVYDRGVLPVYRVWFDDGSSTRACGEHLWKVRGRTERRHGTWSILSTDDILKRGVREKNGRWSGRHFEIPRQGAAQFPHADLPLDPYVLGVWLGDGVRKGGRYATKPTDEIEQEIQRRGYETSGARAGIVNVYGISGHLRKMQLFGRYSYERFVPSQYLHASIAQRRDLLCGLMDTDGGIDVDGHMEFSSTSGRLADHLIWLVRSLGGVAFRKKTVKKPFYYDTDRKKVLGRDCYRITVKLPFNPFLVPHRKLRWTDPARNPSTIRYMTRKIDKIERDGEAHCSCIEVDHPDQLYLTDDSFIVTHNTTVLAWIGWNYLLTRPHPKIGALSVTAQNLSDGLWTEMAKWRNQSPFLQAKFEWTKTRIFAKDHPETWFMSAKSWSQSADASQQANTLAGFHADYVMFLIDESGSLPKNILVAAEAAFAGTLEAHIVQSGNPESLEGMLYHACGPQRHLWKVIEITGDPDDPKRSPRIPITYAREQIQQYGRDNPWVLVNIFGQFPPSSLNALIGYEEVREAMKRYYRDYEIGTAAKILGVDVARDGADSSVVAKRHGIQMIGPLKKYRNLTSTQGAGIVAREWKDWGADAAFIDHTGGFGAGWCDQLILLGFQPIGIEFSGSAYRNERYHNKRAEMAFEFVEWIKRGGALPENDSLAAALSSTTYTFKGDTFLIEPKANVKAKLGYSPDEFDACMLTFAQPVQPTSQQAIRPRQAGPYDPFADFDKLVAAGRRETTYDPFA